MSRSLRSTTLHFGSYNFLPYDTDNRLGLELVRSNEKRLRGLPAAQDKDAFAYKCWYHGSSLMVSQLPSSLFTINGPWELMFYVNITVVIAAKFSDGRGHYYSGTGRCSTHFPPASMTCKQNVSKPERSLKTACGIQLADACWGSIISWEQPNCFRLRRS